MHGQIELEQHRAAMVRVARSVLDSRDEAEECASAAIVQVLEKLPDRVLNLEAYMVTVSKRRALDRLRTIARARRRDAQLAAQLDGIGFDVAEEVAARAEAKWISGEAERRLSPQSLRILTAKADGEDMRGVAQREGLTLRAAESDLFRSRRLLRSVWTRSLAGLTGVYALVRRTAPATLPATAAAMAIALSVAPNYTAPEPQSTGRPTVPAASEIGRQAYLTTAGKAIAGATASSTYDVNRPPLTTRRLRTSPMTTRSIAAARTPLGSTFVQEQQHGSGPSGGPVDTILDCGRHLSTDPHHLGC